MVVSEAVLVAFSSAAVGGVGAGAALVGALLLKPILLLDGALSRVTVSSPSACGVLGRPWGAACPVLELLTFASCRQMSDSGSDGGPGSEMAR